MTAFSIKILSLSGEMVFLRILFDITKTHLIMCANRLITQNSHKHEANHLLLVAVLRLEAAIW